jgi:hypothetical protein
VDIGKAFTFVTDDEGWIGKIAIGGVVFLFSFLIIPVFFLLGYQLAVMRNVKNGEEFPLPKWENWGRLFMDGLYVVIAVFVYTIPIWLLVCIGVLLNLVILAPDSGGAELGTIIIWTLIGCFTILLALALAFLIPSIYIQYARTDDFGSLFRFGEVASIARENVVDILISFLVILVAGFALSLLSAILSITICGGIIATLAGNAWIYASSGHLYGQIAAKSEGKKAEGAYGV